MPKVSLSKKEAEKIKAYLRSNLKSAHIKVDNKVSELKTINSNSTGAPLSKNEIDYLFDGLLTEGHCRHCHSGNTRAADKFKSTERGLLSYVKKFGGKEFWKRIETRAIEFDVGIGAEAPGMPMATHPLSTEKRNLVKRWVEHQCKDKGGVNWCEFNQ